MAVAVYQAGTGVIYTGSMAKMNNFTGFVFVVALILYMGARPVSPEFGDTINYAAEFQTLQTEESGNWMAQATSLRGEWLFALILHAWVQYGNVHDYFFPVLQCTWGLWRWPATGFSAEGGSFPF